MSKLTLTVAEDKDVLFVVGAGDKILVPADHEERNKIFDALTKALANVAQLDANSIANALEGLQPEALAPLPVVADQADNTVVSLADHRAALEK